MNKLIALVAMLFIPPAFATIECTAAKKDGIVQISLDDSALKIMPVGGLEHSYPVVSKEVKGVGDKARHVYSLGELGKVSFKDTYGCITLMKIEIPDWKVLKKIKCERSDKQQACPS